MYGCYTYRNGCACRYNGFKIWYDNNTSLPVCLVNTNLYLY